MSELLDDSGATSGMERPTAAEELGRQLNLQLEKIQKSVEAIEKEVRAVREVVVDITAITEVDDKLDKLVVDNEATMDAVCENGESILLSLKGLQDLLKPRKYSL